MNVSAMSRRRFLSTSATLAAAAGPGLAAGIGRAEAATYDGTTCTVPGEWAPHAGRLMAFPWDATDN
ncbi:twin-arginine translocation signal domain-containing protein [Streptomyces sp. NPDC002520]